MSKAPARPPATNAPTGYPPGHFTALMRRHDWPPGWRVKLFLRDAEEAAEAARLQELRRYYPQNRPPKAVTT